MLSVPVTRHGRLRRLVACAVLTVALVSSVPTASASTSANGAYLTFLFGRTQWQKAGPSCVPPSGYHTLADAVQALADKGYIGVGEGIINYFPNTGFNCTNGAMYPGWDELQTLHSTYGFELVSEGNDYVDFSTLTAAQQQAESCGSLPNFRAHGFMRADGLFAYPNNSWTNAAQQNIVSKCFSFGRKYADNPNHAPGSYPWWASIKSVNGGHCNDKSASCYSLNTTYPYDLPSTLISKANVAAGTWQGIQFYTFVTGSGSAGDASWNCTGSNPADHWTSKGELYCWNDYLSVIDSVPTGVTVTDPASVATAWGRSTSPPPASIQLSPSSSTIAAGSSQSYTAEAFDSGNNDLGDITAQTTFSIDGGGSCTGNSCTAPTPGTYTVTGDDNGTKDTAQLVVQPAPVATIVLSPASAVTAAGTPQTYTAEGYDSQNNDLGDVTAQTTFSISSAGTCSANTCGSATNGSYTVTGNDGGVTASAALDVVPPGLSSIVLSPTSATVGGGVGQAYTAEGYNASNNDLGDVTPETTFTVPAPATCSGNLCSGDQTGGYTVTGSIGSITATASLSVDATPSISSFTPQAGKAGTSVTVNGTDLDTAKSVTFGGVSAASFTASSTTQLTAVVPAAGVTGPIAVSTLDGTATSPTNFTMKPSISSVSPTIGPVGTLVTITGGGLTGPTAVSFNGTPASFTGVSATTVTATVPPGATTGQISVVTPTGTAKSGTFRVRPAITSFSPASGTIGSSVVITGTAFTGATAVKFHGTAATSISVDSDTQITAAVPADTTTGTISVTTAGGTGTSATAFTVLPEINSLSPPSAPTGTPATITGSGFNSVKSVQFNGVSAKYTRVSSTHITATVPKTATTGPVTVTTAAGVATSTLDFTVTTAAAIRQEQREWRAASRPAMQMMP
jgi:hypothetical protein